MLMWKVLLIAVIVLLFFGKGKLSDVMGDVAKGIKSFRKGLTEADEDEVIEAKPAPALRAPEPSKTEKV